MSNSKFYGAFAAPTHASALFHLMLATAKRIQQQPPPPDSCSYARFPVALLFVRGDRAGDGKKLAEEAIASFDYWDKDTAESLDLVMAGWTKDNNGLNFELDEFLSFRRVIEDNSTWTYSGETDLLLLNFAISCNGVHGYFDYSEAIVLPVEAMLRDKHIGSIDGFVSELTTSARKIRNKSKHSGNSPIWEISDHTGVLRAKKDAWEAIKKLILRDYASKFEAMGHFAIKNIQKDITPYLWLSVEQERAVANAIKGT